MRRRDAGGRGDRRQRHAGFVQDGGVHEDDVGHRHERGDAGQDLGLPVGAELLELEVMFEALFQHRAGFHLHGGFEKLRIAAGSGGHLQADRRAIHRHRHGDGGDAQRGPGRVHARVARGFESERRRTGGGGRQHRRIFGEEGGHDAPHVVDGVERLFILSARDGQARAGRGRPA